MTKEDLAQIQELLNRQSQDLMDRFEDRLEDRLEDQKNGLLDRMDDRLEEQKRELLDRMEEQKSELLDRMEEQRSELLGRMEEQKTELLDRMDERLEEQKNELLDIMAVREQQAEQRILAKASAEMRVIIENVVDVKFNLLAEGQQALIDKYFSNPKPAELEARVDFLETMSRKHEREIQELKMAQ